MYRRLLCMFLLLSMPAVLTPLRSPATYAAPARPNVVLIIVDTLRADHLSAYGYPRDTTPNLDAWIASQGVRFQNTSSTASWTFPANAAMMTGMRPSSLGATWETISSAFPGPARPLAERMHDASYYTAGFVTAGFVRRSLGFARGYDIYDDTLATRPLSETLAGPLNSLAISWLQSTWVPKLSGTKPLFLQVYYFDPHSWFNPPPPYDLRYDSTYTGTLTPERFQNGEDVLSGKLTPSPRDIEHLLALYDGEIAYTDAQIGQLLNYLQSIHVLDNALVIFTADHGEQFGEHGIWMHGNSVYEEATRVPLMMRYTGVISAGLVVDTPVQNMDLMPTVLDYTGLSVPAGLDAISLRPQIAGRAAAADRDILSEVDGVTDPNAFAYWIAGRVDQRSLRHGSWKLIHQVGQDADELYQLRAASPYEVNNQAETRPDLDLELRRDLIKAFGLYRALLPVVVSQ